MCYEKLGDLDGAMRNYSLFLKSGAGQSEQFEFAGKRIAELKR
jgi:hypothetical protein